MRYFPLLFISIIFFSCCKRKEEFIRIPFCGEFTNTAKYQITSIISKLNYQKKYDAQLKWEAENGKPLTHPEELPHFPGGDDAWIDFLSKNLQYPKMAKKKEIQGKVWIGFVVDKYGNLINLEVLRGIGGGCDEEALRIMKKSPSWYPGKNQGKNVNVKFRQMIEFRLN